METLEKLRWMPVWLIIFSLIFTAGAFFFNQSLLTHVGDEYLHQASVDGRFTTEQIEKLIEKLDKMGFDKNKLNIEISPTEALDTGVSKDSDEYISLSIETNRVAYISKIFDFLLPGDNQIVYSYSRVAKSEEYFD
ncbi:hypothetical protein [Clostridiisalibacter paucivorans]|uniref:hypothetical protein n=1 Tax=Clostridiisalibacter paucivorans TaxID=408753 RepID=UPI00047DF06F|nr:hypothetical protein [Clostridiisalibacter paucivorans]